MWMEGSEFKRISFGSTRKESLSHFHNPHPGRVEIENPKLFLFTQTARTKGVIGSVLQFGVCQTHWNEWSELLFWDHRDGHTLLRTPACARESR